jgi:hypothetical protein
MDLNLDLSLDLNLNLKLSSDVDSDLGTGPAEHDLGDGVDEELPLLSAPRTSNAELQMTMDAVAERLNGLVRARAASSPPLPPSGHRRFTNRAVSRLAREDKENQTFSEEGWSYVAADEFQGVGLGVDGVDVKKGKEMGNIVFLPETTADSKAKKDKERRGKRELFILP